MSRSQLHIGELARLLGVTPKTVRHYHKLGLCVEPERSESGYRLYTAADLLLLRRIRRLQSLGLSLQQIKSILHSPDPDAMLQAALKELQATLTAQQEQLAARRQRIEDYLAEGTSLVEVEQPDSPSPTYQMMLEKLGAGFEIPTSMQEFDKQVFTQLDAFNWGTDYASSLQQVAGRVGSHADHQATFAQIMTAMSALQTMSTDDPQIAHLAAEIRQSPLLQELVKNADNLPALGLPLTEAMSEMFKQSAEQHLSPAQRRFLELLIDPRP